MMSKTYTVDNYCQPLPCPAEQPPDLILWAFWHTPSVGDRGQGTLSPSREKRKRKTTRHTTGGFSREIS